MTVQAIKSGPKPKKEDGTGARRQRVDQETKPKHNNLQPHVHKPKEQ